MLWLIQPAALNEVSDATLTLNDAKEERLMSRNHHIHGTQTPDTDMGDGFRNASGPRAEWFNSQTRLPAC